MLLNLLLIKLLGLPFYDPAFSENPDLIFTMLPTFILYIVLAAIIGLIFLYLYPMAHMMYIKNFNWLFKIHFFFNRVGFTIFKKIYFFVFFP